MKLSDFLDVVKNTTTLLIGLVEQRYEMQKYNIALSGVNCIYEEQSINSINESLMEMSLSTFAYKGELYNEIANIIDNLPSEDEKEQEVYSILFYFKEISNKLYPQSLINKYDGLNCSDEEKKAWQIQCKEMSSFFINYGKHLIDEDKVKATFSKLVLYINRFAIMFDCVLLEKHIDLLQLQRRWNIYIIEERGMTLYGDYIRSTTRIKELIRAANKPFNSEDAPDCFPYQLNKTQINSLRVFLIEQKLINANTNESSMLYWFGCGNYDERIKPIEWLGTKQQARELLEGIYKKSIKPFANIEKIVPFCFTYHREPLRLSKNKPVPDVISDHIKDFLATIITD